MKTMERNKTQCFYLLYSGQERVLDENGLETGETRVGYGEAVALKASISPAGGSAQAEQFGTLLSYDRVLLVDDLSCPMDENTVLFLDKVPAYDVAGSPLYNYRVKAVARSLNFLAYALEKVGAP